MQNQFLTNESLIKWLEENHYFDLMNIPKLPTEEGQLHLICPPGIGDFAWIAAKWWQVARERKKQKLETIFYFPEHKPRRIQPYADLLGLQSVYLPGIHTQWMLKTPGAPDERALTEGGVYIVHANRHLERGNRIEEWCPFLEPEIPLPTDYLVNTYRQDGPIMVHPCHAGYPDGNLLPGMWAKLLHAVAEYNDPSPVWVIGGNDGTDKRYCEKIMEYVNKPERFTLLFDQPLKEILKWYPKLKAFVGLASGMSILAVYAGVPTIIAYPRWLATPRFQKPELWDLFPQGTKMPDAWEPEGALYAWCFVEQFTETRYITDAIDTLKREKSCPKYTT